MDTVRTGEWDDPTHHGPDVSLNVVPPPGEVPERSTASPELPGLICRARRPVLQRFYSSPEHTSPGRQKFRLQNGDKRAVKETPRINESETPVGRFINQYQVLDPIGNGRYGQVWLGNDSSTNACVAIKEYSKSDIMRANRKRLMQLRRSNKRAQAKDLISLEVAIMKKIDHPNLVELVEVLEDERSDSLYMIMEWCEYGTLPVDGSLDEEQCRLYFRDMILAVEYLHAMGITHRDIKAENVLLGAGDVLKLADFGVSELLESPDKDTLKSCVGSPAYFAPELAHLAFGGANPDQFNVLSGRKTDIWAMGVTLYHMFHGHLPFQAETLEQLYQDICHREPTFRSGISEELKDVFTRLFVKESEKRITMEELRRHPWVTSGESDELLSYAENTAQQDLISEEELSSAIEKAQLLFKTPVDPERISSSLQREYGWRGASGRSTPAGTKGPDNLHSNQNVEKLVRALEEMINIDKWDAASAANSREGSPE